MPCYLLNREEFRFGLAATSQSTPKRHLGKSLFLIYSLRIDSSASNMSMVSMARIPALVAASATALEANSNRFSFFLIARCHGKIMLRLPQNSHYLSGTNASFQWPLPYVLCMIHPLSFTKMAGLEGLICECQLGKKPAQPSAS